MSEKETVRHEAHRLNLSISEVRRRRHGYPARKEHGTCPCKKTHFKEPEVTE
jgi:hypothetical protein